MSKKFAYTAAAALGAIALLGATALPASAAQGTTIATFSLTGGSLNITVPISTVLPTVATGVASVSGSLGDVTVTDTRGSAEGWVMSAISDSFRHQQTSSAISTGVNYNAGTATTTGTVTTSNLGPIAILGAAQTVVNGTAAVGNNTATLNPTLTVVLSASALVGNYTGAVTTSVA